MILTQLVGDLLEVAERKRVEVLVHQANLEHTFGAGIAKQIRLRMPYAYEADLRTNFCDPNKLGSFSIGIKEGRPTVINMYSQTSLYPSHTSYDAMVQALTSLRNTLEPLPHIQRIGFPYQLGSGLADGNWDIVKQIILSVFEDSRFEIVIVKLPEASRAAV